eukprot:TRINITY_DN3958_c0_g1_i1.p1 TRINITY_DN3958_c0_g1~~TRINITY_DN3958_c0_g1_i1.p1  ORF type:complete len:187 (-),score=31.81 TRINITY_DN3958_c0_g1_i1:83-598(-)
MDVYGQLNSNDIDVGFENNEAGFPSGNSLFLGVFITLVPKLLPRLMPMFMFNTSPEMKAKLDEPDYIEENEVMLREKFSEYFKIIEDIIETLDGSPVKKSSEYTGFKKFLFGSLESVDIDVSSFLGDLEVGPLRKLGRIARGEDSSSHLYSMIADGIIAVGSYIYSGVVIS